MGKSARTPRKSAKVYAAGKEKDVKKLKRSFNAEGLLVQDLDATSWSLIEKEKEIIQTEDALLESMKRFRDLFEQSPIGVGINSVSGESLVVNNAYLGVFGAGSFSSISAMNMFKDLGLGDKDIKGIRSQKVIQHETEFDFDSFRFNTQREGKAHVLFTISPIQRDEDVVGYMVQAQDITRIKKIEESQRLAQLGRLLSDMAHEVNNPLMIISGRAELALLDKTLNGKLKDSLKMILDQCFQAKDIIQRLLKYSRLGRAKQEEVDIKEILDLISDILEHHFKMAEIDLSIRVRKNLPRVMGNEKQLQEVFMNIMRNSADAMPDGGTITVNVSHGESDVKITIKDTGEGMSKHVIDRIFEPFFTTKQKGTGLGLAVCHTIVQEHGGKLMYESEEGKGTTATILLPAQTEKTT
jgi:PAS domain S-box-containing protein